MLVMVPGETIHKTFFILFSHLLLPLHAVRPAFAHLQDVKPEIKQKTIFTK